MPGYLIKSRSIEMLFEDLEKIGIVKKEFEKIVEACVFASTMQLPGLHGQMKQKSGRPGEK
jgi:hypothetical protein